MHGEVIPEDNHYGRLFAGQSVVGIDTIRKHELVSRWAKIVNCSWVRFSVGMFKKVLRLIGKISPLIKHPFAEVLGIIRHRRFSTSGAEIMKHSEGSGAKSVDRDRITVVEPKRDSSVGLPSRNVDLCDGDRGHIFKPNV